jgi:hypothetical protein
MNTSNVGVIRKAVGEKRNLEYSDLRNPPYFRIANAFLDSVSILGKGVPKTGPITSRFFLTLRLI